MRWPLVVALLAGCACPNKQAGTVVTAGNGSGSATATPTGTPCERATPKVQALYRADAQSDEAIADNTAMVIAECNRAPDQVAPCIDGVTTVSDLETRCMPKLDEEGSEGDALVR